MEATFIEKYISIEESFKHLAEKEDRIYVPNIEPKKNVDFVFIGMEPSLKWWTRGITNQEIRKDGENKINKGFRNFMYSMDDYILHWCINNYLGTSYHITDLSKGAMTVTKAKEEREERYKRWYEDLLKELELVSNPNTKYVTIGKVVDKFLKKQNFKRPTHCILHYSSQAQKQRQDYIKGREEAFEEFKNKGAPSMIDILAVAEKIRKDNNIPIEYISLNKLEPRPLGESSKMLIFHYREEFRKIRNCTLSHNPIPN